jgi:DNA-binding SARP family transcriptional activator
VLPLTYILVPSTRAHWDAAPLAGRWAAARRVAQALVRLRAGSIDGASPEALPPPNVVCTVLPIGWSSELGLGLLEAGYSLGAELLAALPAIARRHVVAISSTQSQVSRSVRTALTILPRTPRGRVRVQVLGRLEIHREGQVVTDPELRRDRVRQILLYLVAHPNTTRTHVMDALWPDEEDPIAASRNLRVNLTHLQRVLEPDRDEEPYILRSEGNLLTLVADDWLEIDSRDFDRLRGRAKRFDADGRPADALDAYRRALALYRGDYMADVPDAEWAVMDRHHYQRAFLTTAVRAGELLLARAGAGAGAEDALALARRALRVDDTHEPAYRLLAAAHLAQGDRNGAVRALSTHLAQLRALGLQPEPATVMLTRRLETARPGTAPQAPRTRAGQEAPLGRSRSGSPVPRRRAAG